MQIPKFIWSYWNSPELPEIVNMSVNSWKLHNPEYTIIILNQNTWSNFVTRIELMTLKFNDSPQRFSDFLRIYLLAEYGGIWMDASIICFAPINSWLYSNEPRTGEVYLGGAGNGISNEEKPSFIAFTINHVTNDWTHPMFESWFMACEKNSLFMREIYEEFIVHMNTFETLDAYFSHLEEMGVNLHTLGVNHYLVVYFSIQKVMQKSANKNVFRIKTIPAEDPVVGPMYYMIAPNDGLAENSSNLMKLCTLPSSRTALVKLRKDERAELDTRPELACVLKLRV